MFTSRRFVFHLLCHMTSVTFFMSRYVYDPCFLFYLFFLSGISSTTVKTVKQNGIVVLGLEATFTTFMVSNPNKLCIPVTFLSDIYPVMSESRNHGIFVMVTTCTMFACKTICQASWKSAFSVNHIMTQSICVFDFFKITVRTCHFDFTFLCTGRSFDNFFF